MYVKLECQVFDIHQLLFKKQSPIIFMLSIMKGAPKL